MGYEFERDKKAFVRKLDEISVGAIRLELGLKAGEWQGLASVASARGQLRSVQAVLSQLKLEVELQIADDQMQLANDVLAQDDTPAERHRNV